MHSNSYEHELKPRNVDLTAKKNSALSLNNVYFRWYKKMYKCSKIFHQE